MNNEKHIIDRLKKKDEKAFDYLYNKYYKLIYYVVFQYLKDHSWAEEVVSDVFTKMYLNINQYNDSYPFKNWLVQIARNMSINEYNKRKKDLIELNDEYINRKVQEKQQNDYEIFDFINKYLDEYESKIVIYITFFDYKFKELALEFNEKQSTISTKYYRALKKLKEHWKDYKI